MEQLGTATISNGQVFLRGNAGVIRISAENGKCTIENSEWPSSVSQVSNFQIILGILHLAERSHILLVNRSEVVGQSIQGDAIFKVVSVDTIPLGSPSVLKNEKPDAYYIELFQETALSNSLLFSFNFDITHTSQRIEQLRGVEPSHVSLRADKRFFWNEYLLKDFISLGFVEWTVPVMSGFVQTEENLDLDLDGRVKLFLVSRRCRERAGLRYTVRGIDQAGDVGNFVETEVILSYNGGLISYVQVRGSIPLFWQQLSNLQYCPRVDMTRFTDEQQKTAMKLHLTLLERLYGRITIVNLIDKKKDQALLGKAYEEYLEQIVDCTRTDSAIRIVWFDFHHECRKMQWHNLSKLINLVKEDITRFGMFSKDSTGNVLSRQTGVFRTNCIDNLDRTNVVQSILARVAIMTYLNKDLSNVLQSPYNTFELSFKDAWANNADLCSMLYAGTLAQKTDFTRTGKRTFQGILGDFYSGTKRYFVNNFQDGRRQDGLDLFLGRYVPGSQQPYHTGKHPSDMHFLMRFILILIALFVTLVTSCNIRKFDGRNFVDTPRLVCHEWPTLLHKRSIRQDKEDIERKTQVVREKTS